MAKVKEKSEFTFNDAILFIEKTTFTPVFDNKGIDTGCLMVKSYNGTQTLKTIREIKAEEIKRAHQERQKAISAMRKQNTDTGTLLRLAGILLAAAIWATAVIALFIIK